MTTETVIVPKESWWRRRLVAPVVAQLMVGISPERIAWAISLGVVLGVFPIMGTTTLVCLVAGWMLRLNQPVLHVFSNLVYPLHLVLILVFIRMGERLYGAPRMSFSIPQLLGKFKDDPQQFARDFGMSAWHGVCAWLLIAPVAALIVKFAVMPVLKKVAAAIQKRREVAA